MLGFILKYIIHRTKQISEITKEKETKNVDDFIVSESYKEVLNLSIQVYLKCIGEKKITKKVKKIIDQMEAKMNNLLKNFEIASTEFKFDDIVALAMAYFNLGHMYIYINDNLNAAKDHLMRCMELLEGNELHYKVILIAIGALNDLSKIWRNLQKLENCYPFLDKALELYLHYTKEEEYPDPFFVDDFISNQKNKKSLKLLLFEYHKQTLMYMEELYFFQPAIMHKFVIYIHNLLNKYLKTIKNSTDIDMIIYWAETSVDLFLYFICHDRFMEAKIHLAAADYMAAMYYTLIETNHNYSKSRNDIYNAIHTYITHHWAIYGIILLHLSKERLPQYEGNKSCETNKIESESHPNSEEELMKPLTFVDIEKNLQNVVKYYNTDTYVSNLDDVKVIFADVVKWLHVVEKFYDERNLFKTQVQIIIYISKAYTYYAYFIQSKSKRMEVIKQQIEILKNFISTLSSKYSTSKDYCSLHKILHFELAFTYSAFLDIAYEELDEIEEITDERRMEIKKLVENIIASFDIFI